MTDDVTKKEFRVFFSWQSDLNRDFTTAIVLDALNVAKNALEAENKGSPLEVYLDNATRDETGAPDITDSILKKISMADVFICDISTIRPADREGNRAVPNPNVIFELGYAITRLGWERIVMLFNEEYGDFPTDVPFDFRHRRVLRYTYSTFENESESLNNNARKNKRTKERERLFRSITDGLQAIYTQDPTRPSEVVTMNVGSPAPPTDIRRQRDVRTLSRLFSSVDIRSLDYLSYSIETLPQEMLDFELEFDGVVQNGLFHLYDKEAESLVQQLYGAWSRLTSYGEFFQTGHCVAGRGVINYRFIHPEYDMPMTPRQEQALKEIEQDARDALNARRALLEYVREHFDEIDIDEESKKAWERNVRMKEDLFKRFEN